MENIKGIFAERYEDGTFGKIYLKDRNLTLENIRNSQIAVVGDVLCLKKDILREYTINIIKNKKKLIILL